MSNRSELSASRDLGANLGSSTATAIDQMIRWPFWAAGATMDLMLQGMERMTGQTDWAMGTNGTRGGNGSADAAVSTSASGSNSSAGFTSSSSSQNQSQSASTRVSTGDDQDLSGDDLKYVHWSILFCKPGFETVLEPQQDDIVNYSADGPSYAAVKIAKYLEQARNGRADRPQVWAEKGYPTEGSNIPRRTEPANIVGGSAASQQERGWRIPADDQKYIKFLYHVERRLPKEEPVVTRVERVTIERGVEPRSAIG